MIELIKSALLAFMVIHAVETLFEDARHNRSQTGQARVVVVVILMAWMLIRAAPGLYYGVQLIERVGVVT